MCEDTDYKPLFAEEIFIVNLYGTEDEIQRFQGLIARKDEEDSLVAIVDLVEKIKTRCLTGMEWHCCWRCQYFQMCRIRWYREEKDVPQRCCSLCGNYTSCMTRFRAAGAHRHTGKKAPAPDYV